MNSAPLCAVMSTLCATVASAQTILHIESGVAEAPCVGLGDIDGDGHDDFFGPGNLGPTAYSGRNRTVLWSTPDAQTFDSWSAGARVADIDHDGFDDLALCRQSVANDTLAVVHWFSGRTGARIRTSTGPSGFPLLGEILDNAGDVNADGVEDVIASTGRAPALAAAVVVFSGADGATLHAWFDPGGTAWFGSHVSGFGDFDHDGHADVLIGSLNAPSGAGGLGKVAVHSGRTGSEIATFFAPPGETRFGRAFGPLDDLDGDGTLDLAITTMNLVQPPTAIPPFGRVRAFSGASGALLWETGGTQPWFSIGPGLRAIRDLDADGVDDLIVGASLPAVHAASSALVLSGATGARLVHEFFFLEPTLSDFANLGDLNNDGREDLGYWTIGHGTSFAAHLIGWPAASHSPCGVPGTGWPCSGLFYASASTASLTSGDGLRIVVDRTTPHTRGALLWSPNAIATPFAGGDLCVGSPRRLSLAQSSGGAAPCSGQFHFTIDTEFLSANNLTAGTTLFAQAVLRTPLSQASDSTISPTVVGFTIAP